MRKIFIALTVLIFTTTVAIGALQSKPKDGYITGGRIAISDSTGSNTYVVVIGNKPSVDRYNKYGDWVKSIESSQITSNKLVSIDIAFAKDYENNQLDNCLIVVASYAGYYNSDWTIYHNPHADVFFLNIDNDAWTKLNTTPIEGGGSFLGSSIIRGKIFMPCSYKYQSSANMKILSYAECLANNI